MRFPRLIWSGLFTVLFTTGAIAADNSGVIEVVTFKLKPGVSAVEFAPIDHQVELQHVARQPGFESRESAVGSDNEWLVIVHWRSAEDAEASMASFENAPTAAAFMSKIEASTMSMRRYENRADFPRSVNR